MKAVIMCGGKGTRLRPLSYYIQKTMIPIGPTQKPLMEYIIELFKHHGVKEFIMLADYKSEQIKNYFGDGSRFDVEITYLKDKEGYVGTGNAILNAKEEIDGDEFFVYYADIISDINLTEMYKTHGKNKTVSTVAVDKKYAIPVGIAELDETTGKVRKFVEKPTLELLVNMGISVHSKDFFDVVEEFQKPTRGKNVDLSGDILPELARRGQVGAYLTDTFWYDVGSLAKYEKLDFEKIKKIDKMLGFQ